MPVNFARLNNPRRDSVFVALAGPGTNVLLAIVSALLFYVLAVTPAGAAEWLAGNLVNSLQINAVLCVFNMLPVPPLDGGRVAVGILPDFLARPLARLEPYGMLIVLLLFVFSFAGVAERVRDQYPGMADRGSGTGADRLRADDHRAGRMTSRHRPEPASRTRPASRRWFSISTGSRGRSICC